MQSGGIEAIMVSMLNFLMGGGKVDRIRPGILEVTPSEFGAEVLYEEIQRLSSWTLGESADFCGRSEASITMAVSLSDATEQRFLRRAGDALTRIWSEAAEGPVNIISEIPPHNIRP